LAQLPILPVIVCAALLGLTYFGFSTWRYVAHNYRLSEDEASIKRDIARLEQEREQLIAVRDYLKSDEYVEYVARGVLGLVRPDETLVIVSSSAPPAPTPTAPITTGAAAEPWWRRLFVEPPPAATPSP